MATDGSSSSSFAYGFSVHSISKASKQQQNKHNKKKQSPQRKKQSPHQSPPKKPSIASLSIELYTSSCSRLLDKYHLNAANGISLHDLESGTGTFALQAFLEYPNLRRVFGIEQNKNLFHWATQNLLSLIKNGYKNHKYLLVEQIPSTKMTIAQKSSPEEDAKKSFTKGNVVICFIPLKKNNIKKRDNYQGVITNVHEDGIHYDVQLSATKQVTQNVHRESLFKPGTERTLEVARGNLFERADSFRADIIILPYTISNDSFKSLLLTGCKRSPLQSRILSYTHLESWDGFPTHSLRRVDRNVYDNDRYETNLSYHQKLYIYQHCLSPFSASSPKDIANNCRVGSEVTVRDKQSQTWYSGKVVAIDTTNKVVSIRKDTFIETNNIENVSIDEQRIHLLHKRFKCGDLVCLYCPKKLDAQDDDMFCLFRGQVVICNYDGTYAVQYEDGETHPKIHQCYLFERPRYKYKENMVLRANRYDKMPAPANKESKPLQENCVIRHTNADGTYRVEFENRNEQRYHDSFCESYLSSSDDIKQQIDPILPLALEIDYDKVTYWRPNIVRRWLVKCNIDSNYCKAFEDYAINGVFLFDLDLDLLTKDIGIPRHDAVVILGYIRALKSAVRFATDDDDEQIQLLQEKIQEFQRQMLFHRKQSQECQMKLDRMFKSNNDAKAYHDYELKVQCIELGHRGVSKKEISQKLKKNQNWVKKNVKLKMNHLKKPHGNVAKQIEQLRYQKIQSTKHIKDLETKLAIEKNKLNQYVQ